MKFTIAQIGANRLAKVLVGEKNQDPKLICNAIKSDISNILESYLDDFEISIDAYNKDKDIIFEIIVNAKRVKNFGTLPY